MLNDAKLENWSKAMDTWDKCSCVPKRLCPHALEARKASEALDAPEQIRLVITKNRDTTPPPIKMIWNTNFSLDAGEASR